MTTATGTARHYAQEGAKRLEPATAANALRLPRKTRWLTVSERALIDLLDDGGKAVSKAA
jgi:hypothetical protein